MPKKIVITGPESSGKTTLAEQLSAWFGMPWVPEFSREYLSQLGRSYQPADLLAIAEGQILAETRALALGTAFLFFDTSLEVLKIWSDVRYGSCDPFILEKLDARKPDLYLLCHPDLPWQPDPLRENPDDRYVLLEKYRALLAETKVCTVELEGMGEVRTARAVAAISWFLQEQ